MVEGVWCYHGYKTINMVLAFITVISHVNASNSKLNILYPVKFLYEITDMSEGERSGWDGGGHRVKSG